MPPFPPRLTRVKLPADVLLRHVLPLAGTSAAAALPAVSRAVRARAGAEPDANSGGDGAASDGGLSAWRDAVRAARDAEDLARYAMTRADAEVSDNPKLT